jgi:hypothetical protein
MLCYMMLIIYKLSIGYLKDQVIAILFHKKTQGRLGNIRLPYRPLKGTELKLFYRHLKLSIEPLFGLGI